MRLKSWRLIRHRSSSLAERLASDRRLLGAAAALGVVILLVALTGGPVKALGFELPSADTIILRWTLAGFGLLIISASGWLWARSPSDSSIRVLPSSLAQPDPGHVHTNPHQLPRDIPNLTGRSEILTVLVKFLGHRGEQRSTALPVVAIAGKAGVGKTALATRLAHLVRDFYPDGQLYASLRDPTGAPFEPERKIGELLFSLGVPRSHIPDGGEERELLYRELLSDKRVLIVLDDANGEGQVRPLLPGGEGCAVIVSSRGQLSALDGACLVELEVLEPDAAVELLASVMGAERVSAEHEAAIAIAGLCGYLPLAVSIAGARLAKNPQWALSDMVDRLMDERRRLGELSVGDREVRASFALTYGAQPPLERRAFRMLGLLNVEDFSGWVLAALLGCDPEKAQWLMERLVDERLIEDAGKDITGLNRYRFHSLLRLFARECLEVDESQADRQAALQRALHAYLELAITADANLDPHGMRYSKVTPPIGWMGVCAPATSAVRTAPIGWFEVERLNLLALLNQAEEADLWQSVCALASRLSRFFAIRAHWQDWEEAIERTQQAAQKHNDTFAEALASYYLGVLNEERGRFEEALAHLQLATSSFRTLGDRRAEAHALVALAIVHGEQRRWSEAIKHCELAVPIFLKYGMQRSEAYALRILCNLYRGWGRWDEAIDRAIRSLELYEAANDRLGEAWVLRSLGDICRDLRQFDEALQLFQQALQSFRQFGDRGGQSRALRGLGIVHRERDEYDLAAVAFEQALTIARKLGDRITETRILVSYGVLHGCQQHWEEAEAFLGQALPIASRFGDRHEAADALFSLGILSSNQGRPSFAKDYLEQALEMFRQCESPLWQARALTALGHVYERLGRADAAHDARRGAGRIAQQLSSLEPDRKYRRLVVLRRERDPIPSTTEVAMPNSWIDRTPLAMDLE